LLKALDHICDGREMQAESAIADLFNIDSSGSSIDVELGAGTHFQEAANTLASSNAGKQQSNIR
jgi:hypothetical protein